MTDSGEACRLPEDPGGSQFGIIHRMLELQRIAVVGLSDDPAKPSYRVAKYLKDRGKTIIPVNPNHQTVLGLKCYPSLEAVPDEVELVDVFRRPQYCPEVVRSAIDKGVKGIWLQSGITSEESRELACSAGIDYIEDRCLMVEHNAAL